MSDRLATLERTDEGGLIRFERDFPNSPEDVWSALTDADRLADCGRPSRRTSK
jgi:carbon monoxide dehydrogenase subunit G